MTQRELAPYAITMWDFSWLERRWPGAGYEDWDQILDELVERGYDAVRIDAYPHLVARDPRKVWELLPQWSENTWGAQSLVRVAVEPGLCEFIGKARDRGVAVALSSWFRQDRDDVRLQLTTPAAMADVWIATLRLIEDAGLLDAILYVDLCNEFPHPPWAPFLYEPGTVEGTPRADPTIGAYMRESIAAVREHFPDLTYTYSFSGDYESWRDQDVAELDFLEPHVWMSSDDYYERVGWTWDRFSPEGFNALVARGRRVYEEDKEVYDRALFAGIDLLADWSRVTRKPLITTEGWAVVDYRDWPGLDWDWVLDLNARAVEYAAGLGRWAGICTSNFCGPQFVGVWREVEWHRRLTSLIKSAPLDSDLRIPAGLLRRTHA